MGTFPLGWTLVVVAFLVLGLVALRRAWRSRWKPHVLEDDGVDWGNLGRQASAIARTGSMSGGVLAAPGASVPGRADGPPRERVGLMARWRVELRGPDGQVKDVREFKNLIVNVGLDQVKDRMFNPATAAVYMGWIAIGTGAVPEVATDVALGAEAARGAVTYTAGGTGVCTIDRTFAAGVGTGTITEVGAFDAAAAGNMFNRKTFGAIVKAAGDSLKASCVVTLTAV